MKATNDFKRRVVALSAGGQIKWAGPNTWADDRSVTLEGEVAGTTGKVDEEEWFWPSEPIETIEQYRLAAQICTKMGAKLCCVGMSDTVREFMENRMKDSVRRT